MSCRRVLLSGLVLLLSLAAFASEGAYPFLKKGIFVGRVVYGHPGGTAAERDAAAILCRVPFSAQPLRIRDVTRPAKGDIVLCERSGLPEDAYRLLIGEQGVRIEGEGKGLGYGVVEFLKKYLDIDYWGGGEFYIPSWDELRLPAVDTLVTPTFRYRQSQHYALSSDPLFKCWYHLEEPSELFAANYWVHTCDRLLPASRYGEDHPEYYAYYNGRRNPGSASQWCFSNPEVLDIVCARVDSLFRAYPEQPMISISQNDGSDTYCRCPDCLRVMEEEGSPIGPILRFINAVAERFPDRQISTLAYLFTVQPPRKTVPRENVSIMLCDIDCRRQTALDENPSGQEFMRSLEGWSAISQNLFVWDYGINFDNYLSPFPNFGTIKANMDIFAQHGVQMHFSQISSVRGGDMAELRSYLVCQLMWDHQASRDSLERRFLSHYYGAAAEPIHDYIHLMEGAAVATDVDLFIYDSPVSYKDNILRPALMRRYEALFDEAERRVAQDSLRLSRVRRSRLSLQYAALEIARTDPDRDREALSAALDVFETRVREAGVQMINERSNTPEEYCRLYRQRYLTEDSGNLALGCPVEYRIEPRPKYRELARHALTDGILGGTTYVENWVGWEGSDASFVIDLGEEKAVSSISVDFLRQLGAWILMPRSLSFAYGNTPEASLPIGTVDIPEDRGNQVAFIPVGISCDIRARYIRVDVEGTRICPSWHYGVGNPAWFFIDEVVVH